MKLPCAGLIVIILLGLYAHSQIISEHSTITNSGTIRTGPTFGSPGSGSIPSFSWNTYSSYLSSSIGSLGESFAYRAEQFYGQGRLVEARKDIAEALAWGAAGTSLLESRNWLRGLDQQILESAQEHIQSHEWATAHDELRVLLIGHAQRQVREEALQLIQLADEPVFLAAREAFAAGNWEVAADGFAAIRFGEYSSDHKAEAGRFLATALLNSTKELEKQGLWQFASYTLNSFGLIREASRAERREAHRLRVFSYQRWGEEAYRQHDWTRALNAFVNLRMISKFKGEEDRQAANLADANIKRIQNIRTIPQRLSKQSLIVDIISDPDLRPLYVHVYGIAQSGVDNMIALHHLNQLPTSKVWKAAVVQLGTNDVMFLTPSADKLLTAEKYFGTIPAGKVLRTLPFSENDPHADYSLTGAFDEGARFLNSVDDDLSRGDGLGARESFYQYLQERGHSMARAALVRNWLRPLDIRIVRNAEQHMLSGDWFKAHRELRTVLEGHVDPVVRNKAFNLIQQTGDHLLNEANDAFDRGNWEVAVEEFSEIWLGPHDSANHRLISKRLTRSLANAVEGLYREAKRNATRDPLFKISDERVALSGASSRIALLCSISDAASQDRRRVQIVLQHWQNETNDSENSSFITKALSSLTDSRQRGRAPALPFSFYVYNYHFQAYRSGPTYKTGQIDQDINSLLVDIPVWLMNPLLPIAPVPADCCSRYRVGWNVL